MMMMMMISIDSCRCRRSAAHAGSVMLRSEGEGSTQLLGRVAAPDIDAAYCYRCSVVCVCELVVQNTALDS